MSQILLYSHLSDYPKLFVDSRSDLYGAPKGTWGRKKRWVKKKINTCIPLRNILSGKNYFWSKPKGEEKESELVLGGASIKVSSFVTLQK